MGTRFDTIQATIPNGQSVSQGFSLLGSNAVALKMPATWTAADMTFEASFDGGTTWAAVFDDANAEVKVAAATTAARVGDVIVSAGTLSKLGALPMVRIRSGVKGANVNQGQVTTVGVVAKFI